VDSDIGHRLGEGVFGGLMAKEVDRTDRLEAAMANLAETQDKIIRYIQNEEQKRMASAATFTRQERRDLLDKVVDPPRRIMASLSNISPLQAFMIPAMDIIKYNFRPVSEWPIDDETGKPMRPYDLWEYSLYMNSLGQHGRQSIRMAGVAETRAEVKGFGLTAE
jgi:hypothetical protein